MGLPKPGLHCGTQFKLPTGVKLSICSFPPTLCPHFSIPNGAGFMDVTILGQGPIPAAGYTKELMSHMELFVLSLPAKGTS